LIEHSDANVVVGPVPGGHDQDFYGNETRK